MLAPALVQVQIYRDFLEVMRLTWAQHLQAARTIELHREADQGMALALLGVALLMLSQDLLAFEQQAGSIPLPAAGFPGDGC